jgi:hypothetical protein
MMMTEYPPVDGALSTSAAALACRSAPAPAPARARTEITSVTTVSLSFFDFDINFKNSILFPKGRRQQEYVPETQLQGNF